MQKKIQIVCLIGTRPEAIKMAPVISRLRATTWANCLVVVTAQHRDLLDQELKSFGIKSDIDLNIMTPNQTLSHLTAKLLSGIETVLRDSKPDALLAQGDTTTVLAAALACFYEGIPFGHVEAGLRTGDFKNPFPEEFNRYVSSRIARWHFAPTERAKQNLISEGIDSNTIYVTGNTVIDALLSMVGDQATKTCESIDGDRKLIVVTVHRRENFGEPLRRVCQAILKLANQRKQIQFVILVHPNPNVAGVINELLNAHPRIMLCSPMNYKRFINLLKEAYLILTDSGGLQEEGPALGKPVLVLREKTERPEALEAGVIRTVGTNIDTIVDETQALLDDPRAYKNLARGISPFGDGRAAERIISVLKEHLVDRIEKE